MFKPESPAQIFSWKTLISVLLPPLWPASAVSLQEEAERRGKVIKYAGQEVTLRSSQTCASAVMGMRFSVQHSTLWHYVTLSKNTGIT